MVSHANIEPIIHNWHKRLCQRIFLKLIPFHNCSQRSQFVQSWYQVGKGNGTSGLSNLSGPKIKRFSLRVRETKRQPFCLLNSESDWWKKNEQNHEIVNVVRHFSHIKSICFRQISIFLLSHVRNTLKPFLQSSWRVVDAPIDSVLEPRFCQRWRVVVGVPNTFSRAPRSANTNFGSTA